jgi:hypothetical protein
MSPLESFLSGLVNGAVATFQILPDNARVHQHAIEQHQLKIADKDEDIILGHHRRALPSEIPQRQVCKQLSRWDEMAYNESPQSVTTMRLMAPKRPMRVTSRHQTTLLDIPGIVLIQERKEGPLSPFDMVPRVCNVS